MMVWALIYATDGSLLLVCPAEDAAMWWMLDGSYFFRYQLVEAEL